MDGRQQRGCAIAATMRIQKNRLGWKVPSQTGSGSYVVNLEGEPICTCPDFETRNAPCKHIFAVEFTIRRESAPDGTISETQTVRVTYRQDWPAYNAAQVHEKEHFVELLDGLCAGIEQPPQARGRPRLPLRDVVLAAALKVYSTRSGRRAVSEFLAHYHKRSNVETTFSMIKGKFGASIRSKAPTAQRNEVMLKVLCHNVCVLVQSIYELGIEPTFWAPRPIPASRSTA